MNIDEAKNILAFATKGECRDHAFGDVEIYWEIDGEEVGFGYFGGGIAEVTVKGTTFTKTDAHELRKIFSSEEISRNDATGPDTFTLGQTMPGLTLEGVRKELTGE